MSKRSGKRKRPKLISENSKLHARLTSVPALAYLLTFSTYGTHLQGSEKGWVDARHSRPGSPMLASNPRREVWWLAHLNETPWVLTLEGRQITLDMVRSVCTHRQWLAHAIHVRTTHVHAVVAGEGAPERMLSDFKAYATRALRRAFPRVRRRRYWTDHGSTRYLWNEVRLGAAIQYVLHGQGEQMLDIRKGKERDRSRPH